MPQISLYVDATTLQLIEKNAHRKRVSISKWVGDTIKASIADDYPEGYLSLFGAVADDSFVTPARLDPSADARREQL